MKMNSKILLQYLIFTSLIISVGINIFFVLNIRSHNNQISSVYSEGKIRSDLALASAALSGELQIKKALALNIEVEINNWMNNNKEYSYEFSCRRIEEIIKSKEKEIDWLDLDFNKLTCPISLRR